MQPGIRKSYIFPGFKEADLILWLNEDLRALD